MISHCQATGYIYVCGEKTISLNQTVAIKAINHEIPLLGLFIYIYLQVWK